MLRAHVRRGKAGRHYDNTRAETATPRRPPHSKPLCRKLIVVEGIYTNYGDIAPLDRIYEIKEKYK